MGISVLDPNDYVPDPKDDLSIPLPAGGMTATGAQAPWMGMGPQLAAQGNFGGLSQALVSGRAAGGQGGMQAPTMPQYGSGGAQGGPQGGLGAANPLVGRMLPTRPFAQDEAQQIGALMRGRVRSNEDIANAVEQRKGALEQLIEANSKPSNPLSWGENFLMGTGDAPYYASGDMAASFGIKGANDAYKEKLAQQQAQGVQNAQLRLQNMQGEEQYSNAREKDALGDMSKILSAQQKSSIASQLGIIHTADGVMQIGPDGIPHMIMPATKDYKTLVTKATQVANNALQGFTFSTPEERQAAFNKEFQNAMNQQSDAVSKLIGTQMQQGSVPQATPSPGGMNPSVSLGSGLTAPAGSNNTNLSQNGRLQKALQDAGGNPLHAATSMWESYNKPNAVNPTSGAAGPMQVVPGTQTNPGFGVKPAQNNTPEELRRVGNDYLDAMVNKYGSEPVGLVAYNMGPGATDKWLAEGADPRKLPAETREYVSGVLLNKQMMQQPQQAAAPAGQPTQNQSAANTPANTQATPAGVPTQSNSVNEADLVRPVSGTLLHPEAWAAKYSAVTPSPFKNGPLNTLDKAKYKAGQDAAIKANQKDLETWSQVADAGKEEDTHIDTIRQLMANGYTPGMDATYTAKVGRLLQLAGVPDSNSLVQKGISANQIMPAVSRMINDRVLHEKGQQTDQDISRIDATYPHVTDTPQGFQFKLDHLQELAQRNMMRVQFARALQHQDPTADLRSAWNRFSDEQLGPSVMMLGKQPMTRQQFIQQSVQYTMGKHPDADQEDLQQQAASKWMDLAKQTGWMRDAK